MNNLLPSPAATRMAWVLDGINGGEWTEKTVGENLTAQLLESLPAKTWVERLANMTEGFAPLTLAGLDLDSTWAKARVKSRDGPRC